MVEEIKKENVEEVNPEGMPWDESKESVEVSAEESVDQPDDKTTTLPVQDEEVKEEIKEEVKEEVEGESVGKPEPAGEPEPVGKPEATGIRPLEADMASRATEV